MTSGELLLNLGILAFVLYFNLGVKSVTRKRFVRPLVIVAIAGYSFLPGSPTHGNDVPFALLGAGAGLALGLISASLVRVYVRDGEIMTRAGAGFAALWIAVVGGRIAFSEAAAHVFPHSIATFSAAHDITSSDAWVSMFVLMALGMVVGRLGVLAVQSYRIASRSARSDGSSGPSPLSAQTTSAPL